MTQRLYIGLVHHPVIDKNGELITTSVTNLDIHDIARTARTFNFRGYFIITPIELQRTLVSRILKHWNTKEGRIYNTDRMSALSFARLSNSIEEAKDEIRKAEGLSPLLVVTGANFKEYSGDASALKEFVEKEDRPVLLIFGTGWGLHPAVVNVSDFKLTPIFGTADDNYNHLSVRSAVAIYADRISRAFSL